jgi:hypothetical protein
MILKYRGLYAILSTLDIVFKRGAGIRKAYINL